MILVCGIPTEPPLEMVTRELEAVGAEYALLNQREVAHAEVDLDIQGGVAGGALTLPSGEYGLGEFSGVYHRLMDDRFLPELVDEPPGSRARAHSRAVHEALLCWMEIVDARVVNRPSPMTTNFSKPYQAQLIQRHGLRTPETLITNDPAAVTRFREEQGALIYKSISCLRSEVQMLGDEDLSRLGHIVWCPTQFQKWIDGIDVRVHVVGDRTFATSINTRAPDYRYASRRGQGLTVEPVELPDELARQCVDLSRGIGLAFSGIDLRITPEMDAYCLEVNPCPAFSYYEQSTGQPIAEAVVGYMTASDGP